MAFYNQGSRPNFLASIEPIQFKQRPYSLDKVHGNFVGEAVSFLSEIRPEDFNAPKKLWNDVFDEKARQRFVKTVSGHMSTCREKEILKKQIAIFREVDEGLAAALEKELDVKGYDGIANLGFNGSHNGMKGQNREDKICANGMPDTRGVMFNNGAPQSGKV